jgi:hypothetical protein
MRDERVHPAGLLALCIAAFVIFLAIGLFVAIRPLKLFALVVSAVFAILFMVGKANPHSDE